MASPPSAETDSEALHFDRLETDARSCLASSARRRHCFTGAVRSRASARAGFADQRIGRALIQLPDRIGAESAFVDFHAQAAEPLRSKLLDDIADRIARKPERFVFERLSSRDRALVQEQIGSRAVIERIRPCFMPRDEPSAHPRSAAVSLASDSAHDLAMAELS